MDQENRPAAPVSRLVAYSLAVILILAWGCNYSVQKELLARLGPAAVLVARYAATPLAVAVMLTWRFGMRWPRLTSADWGALAGLAVVGHVLHVSVMTHAMHLSTPFSSALISACGPLFTLIIVRFTGSQRFSRFQVVGVLLAVFGVLIFLSDKLNAGAAHTLGDLLLLLGTILFSIHTVAARQAIERMGVFVVMGYCTLLASVPIVAMNLPAALDAPWADLSVLLWAGLGFALTASFGGWLIWGWLTANLGVPKTAPLLYLLPPVAGLIAWTTLGETFTLLKILGSLLALLGVALAQFAGRPAPVTVPARRAT